ncbi:MAG: N-acetylmuramoyl-L-alanine amidase-like domain-containing protein [Pseudomonadota bacterium]|nr:N-acetylmuramoyl-L-alanine amidase-like domain-containing protein [Pseudomonadota bacterium]
MHYSKWQFSVTNDLDATDNTILFQEDFFRYSSLLGTTPTLNEKLTACTSVFLNRPYQYDPLGDGEFGDIDRRPLINTKQFDCFSFCNIVLAMINGETPEDALENLKIIRYGSSPTRYFNRFHFVESQWNTANRKEGFIKNVTASVFDASQLHSFNLRINLPKWATFQNKYLTKKFSARSPHQPLPIPPYFSRPVDVNIDYVSLDTLLAGSPYIIEKIPEGTICQLVCKDWDLATKIGTQIAICHLGIITKSNQTLYFNQAEINAHVMRVPLDQYLHLSRKHHPHITGIRLESIQPNTRPIDNTQKVF